jgi:nucleotide-binding universal stress UspA family protein
MQIRRILMATDCSPAALAAEGVVEVLAKTLGAEVTLLYVDEIASFGFHSAEELSTYVEKFAAVIDEQLERSEQRFIDADIKVETIRTEGKAWREILKNADRYEVDLIAVAKHGSRGLQRMLVGSTTTRVVRRAALPVLVVPANGASEETETGEDAPISLRRILATTDFSEDSDEGMKRVVELADKLDSEVLLTHVVRFPSLIPTIPGEIGLLTNPNLRARMGLDADKELMWRIEELRSTRVRPQVLFGYGIAETLTEGEAAERTDLYVIPTHGKGRIESLLLGSNTDGLLSLARKPVLVMPRTFLAASAS